MVILQNTLESDSNNMIDVCKEEGIKHGNSKLHEYVNRHFQLTQGHPMFSPCLQDPTSIIGWDMHFSSSLILSANQCM